MKQMFGKTRLSVYAVLIAGVLTLACCAIGVYALPLHSYKPEEFHLFNGAQQGIFNIGPSRSSVSPLRNYHPEFMKLDYTVPPGSSAGAWTRAALNLADRSGADLARIRVHLTQPDPPKTVAVVLELKGAKDVQRIPLQLHQGWNSVQHTVDWNKIGKLKEGVVSVSRIGAGAPATGTLSFDVALTPMTLLQKLSLRPAVQMLAVLLLSLLVIGLSAVPSLVGIPQRIPVPLRIPAAERHWPKGLMRDVVLGSSSVLVLLVSLGVYSMGGQSRLDTGWTVLALAAAGGLLAEWMKYGLTGKHLTPPEAFRDMVFTGALTVSSSSLSVLQAPSGWRDILLLSSVAAGICTIAYHAANLYGIAKYGRHLSSVAGAMIVGTPYLTGSLLLLESATLMERLGNGLTAGLLTHWPDKYAGGFFVIWTFNEALSLSLEIRARRGLSDCVRTHAIRAAAAAAVVAAPWIADLGSGQIVSALPAAVQWIALIITAAVSQAALWPEVYLVTGVILDSLRDRKSLKSSAALHAQTGLKRGMIFGGVWMGLLGGMGLLGQIPGVIEFGARQPWAAAAIAGCMGFPLAKTLMETFDGSRSFLSRLLRSYRDPELYLRGAVVGLGLGFVFSRSLSISTTPARVAFGAVLGVAASGGISILRDIVLWDTGRGRLQSWKVYVVQSGLGMLIGAGLGFYLDAAQVSSVVDKFQRYISAGQVPQSYGVYPLLSKWGHIQLGTVAGGVKLLYSESVAGVISWAIPAWLFAVNASFMSAYFRREKAPILALFSRQGVMQLGQNTIQVFRWGLWMSPIISSLIRPMGTPTWYNQDGAIRTLVAAFHSLTSSPEAFRAWSLGVFVSVLAYNSVRILIWLDHMGIRVATLVNLSFQGMDRLDRRLARFLGPAATAHCIPEGIKRFATWAPLLIPFYIPRGADWDYAWSHAEALRASAEAGMPGLLWVSPARALLVAGAAVLAATAIFSGIRRARNGRAVRKGNTWKLGNQRYELVLKSSGEMFSRNTATGYDLSRRSYDTLDPAGRALFLVDTEIESGSAIRHWALLGHVPRRNADAVQVIQHGDVLEVSQTQNGIRTGIDIRLAGDDSAEMWIIRIDNLGGRSRSLRLVPYIEWVLNTPESDRGHTQYNRLYPAMEYIASANSVLAWHKQTKAWGILAADKVPEGFLTSRIDFIGRAQSIVSPRVLETLAFSASGDTAMHSSFDPIGSLLINADLEPGESKEFRILIGIAGGREEAMELVSRNLGIRTAHSASLRSRLCSDTIHHVRHGEILPGTPQAYSEYIGNGRKLRINTPLTPRPYDHTMSNRLGHVMVVTNRGLHTSSNGNSQQNRLTPDWADIVTREVPGEALYLYDPDERRWYSPTYHPLNDAEAQYQVEFGADGTAEYRMTKGSLETELTTFVPADDPAGVYRLTVRNKGGDTRRMRVASYFQMVLSDQPESSGPLKIRVNRRDGVLFFQNPRNESRTGPVFVASSMVPDLVETRRGRFFGDSQNLANPFMVRNGEPDSAEKDDKRPVAALLNTLEIPPSGQRTITIVLGQADSMKKAAAIARKYRDQKTVDSALDSTRRWWTSLIDTVQVQSADPEVDRYLDWLKYQTLAERIWARRGFYQASGAYGFRDQLQDAVNLIWMDPLLARNQILLHAAQQFVEGDTVHWFHCLQDGRTGFAARTHASDNLLWLAWAAVEYIGLTGDDSLLDKSVPYLEAEQPLAPLPVGKHGLGFEPLRSVRADSVYRHCLRAIDLVLERRTGAHGLPLIGTGDWNDGLDEIGSDGRGESVWLGFFLYYILQRMIPIVAKREGEERKLFYVRRAGSLAYAIQRTWRGDRYLRAIHDDGTEIGLRGSGVWEIDALTAAWAVMSGIDHQRGRIAFDTAIAALEQGNTILLGWPALREDTNPYLGRSSQYPEGVRENGMYCHGVQWLVGAARILSLQCRCEGDVAAAKKYSQTAYRLWRKISAFSHVTPGEIEIYGGQPNKQAADLVTAMDPGRMGWHGYTGAAGWMFRQSLEGVFGFRLVNNRIVVPSPEERTGPLDSAKVSRVISRSPLQ